MKATPSMLVRLVVVLVPVSAGCVGSPGTESSDSPLSPFFCPEEVPQALAPAPNQFLRQVLMGDGVQIYQCKPGASGYAWSFVAPEADLLDPGDQVVGTHYAGPTWQAIDGSSVRAVRRAGVTVDTASIPWLLLDVVSHEGQGRFADFTSIQRLDTAGGLAPTSGCDATSVGTMVRVPYLADYFFYVTGQGNPDQNPQCR
jgi:uncharacterized protein DUF3455